MLRIALRVFLALGLLVQGAIGASAAFAAGPDGHRCHSSYASGGHAKKCPCCPAKPAGMSCADFCTPVAAVQALPVSLRLAPAQVSHVSESEAIVAALLATPLRPPIS
jgi:hypothetical protein